MRRARTAAVEEKEIHHDEAINLLVELVRLSGAHIEARRTFPFPHVYRLCVKDGSGRKVDPRWIAELAHLKLLAIKRLDDQYDAFDYTAVPEARGRLERMGLL